MYHFSQGDMKALEDVYKLTSNDLGGTDLTSAGL